MNRISTNMANNDSQYHMRLRETEMNNMQNKISEQTRIKELRDDPVAAAHSSRYQSLITRLNRFSENIETVQDNNRITEGYLNSSNEILQRIREIAVQGSNDTFTSSDKKIMADEVNQYLNELVEIANARSSNGTSIFAGSRTQSLPFRSFEGNVPGADGKMITGVQYTGTIEARHVEISEGSYIQSNLPGNNVFWAEQQQLFSNTDTQTYQVQKDSGIMIDGVKIDLNAGDNIHTVIAAINRSDAAVRASLDPVKNSLVLETTSPHQLWLEDAGDGTVLNDLGVLSDIGRPPHNISADSRVSGGSMFDMVIFLRDSLYSGDTIDIGGSALKGLSLAQDNLLSSITEVGTRDARLDSVYERLSFQIPDVKQQNSRQVDLDLAEAITNLKMLEYNHKAALQTAARILQPTLLDFLR